MKNHRQLATILGGLTVLTAALFAQTPSASTTTSATARAGDPAVVNPSVTPAVPVVGTPAQPMNPATPAPVNPRVTPAVPPVVPPTEPMKPAAPRISPSPAVQAGATVTPAPTPSPAVPTTDALDASGRMNSPRLSLVDTNGDGRITSAEYSTYMSRTGPASPRVTTKTKTLTPTTGAGSSVSANPTFIELDTDHDGYLSQAEIDAGGSWKR